MATNRQPAAYIFAPFSQKIPSRIASQNIAKSQRQSKVVASFSLNPKSEFTNERPYTISSSSGISLPEQLRAKSRNITVNKQSRNKTQEPINSRVVTDRPDVNTEHKNLLYKRRATSKSPISIKNIQCQSCKKLKCLCPDKEDAIQLQKIGNTSQEEFKSGDEFVGEDEMSEPCSDFEEEEKSEAATQEFLPDSPVPKLKMGHTEVDTRALIQDMTSRVRTVLMRKPIYQGRPSTVLFDYLACCQQPSRVDKRTYVMSDEEIESKPLLFRVGEGAHTLTCFMSAFKHAGFKLTNSSINFNVAISRVPKPEFLKKFNHCQKINHFPGIWAIGRKDNLWRHVLRQRRKFGKQYEICPQTYILPEDFSRFEMDRDENSSVLWILKPAA